MNDSGNTPMYNIPVVLAGGCIVALPPVAVSTSTVPLLVFWLQNTSTKLRLFLTNLLVGVQPNASATGNSMYNMEVRLQQATTKPTANFTSMSFGVLDTGVPFVPPSLAYGWNGTGSGMTTTNMGIYTTSFPVSLGTYNFAFQDGYVLAPNISLGILMKLNSFSLSCLANLTLTGYYG